MNKVRYFDSPRLMAEAAAETILELYNDAHARSGKFTIALSGGSTPTLLYRLLTEEPYLSEIRWKDVFVFWGDERCVSIESIDNNSRNARETLLNSVPIPEENIFAIPVELSPEAAAAKYEQTLKSFFNNDLPTFDLILLGMGTNGHTASLFPETSVLHETASLVKEVYVEEVKMWRITFTARLINNAENILFLVAGKDKKEMLKMVLEGEYHPEDYPAQLIKNAEWFISGE